MLEIQKSLLAIITSFDERLPHEQLEHMRTLIRVGEPRIVMENLCTQIYEYEFSISRTTFETLRCIGTQMGVSAEYWERLDKQ